MELVINPNCRFGSQTYSFVCRGTALDSINHNEGTGFSTIYRRSRNSWVAKCDQSKRDECIVLSAWFRSEEMAFRDNFSKWIRWKLFYDNSFRLSRPKVVQLLGTRPTKYHNRSWRVQPLPPVILQRLHTLWGTCTVQNLLFRNVEGFHRFRTSSGRRSIWAANGIFSVSLRVEEWQTFVSHTAPLKPLRGNLTSSRSEVHAFPERDLFS